MSAKIQNTIIGSASETKSERSVCFSLFQDVRLLLIGLWLGAAVFFSFAVAPGAFAVLPSRELAGAVVQRTLAIINLSGFVFSLLLLVTAFFGFNQNKKRIALWIETVSLIILSVSTSICHWVIAAKLQAIRLTAGRPIEEFAQTDPLRVAFGSLHGYSVIVLSIGMIAALVAFLLIARRRG